MNSESLAHLSGEAAASISELLDRYAQSWSTLRLQEVADLWDETEVQPIYMAQELRNPLIGHSNIVHHLKRTARRLADADVRIGSLLVKQLAPDLALATFICRWHFVLRETRLAWTGHSRVTALFRRRAGEWRFIHYMEDSIFIP
jgi:hypothetical protein